MTPDGVHIPTITPRNVIRCAFAAGLIDDGEAWIDMLTDRNAMSHQYDFAVFQLVADKVHHRYLQLFEALWERPRRDRTSISRREEFGTVIHWAG